MNGFVSQQAEKILACYTDSSLSSCLNKSQESDLEKSGEGSRGGKIIGRTKSGKPIYESTSHESTSHEWKHGLKIGDTVQHEKRQKKIKEVNGNMVHFHGESDPIHVSKIYNKEGKSFGRNVEKAEEDELEKGIVDDLSYQSKENSFISTNGKEMKTKLEAVKTRNIAELSNIAIEQAALTAQIGAQPDRDDDSYQLERYNGLIPTPKTYSYEYCDKVTENVPYLYEAPKTEAPEVNISALKSQYRDLVHRSINIQVENLQIDTFVRNTKDDKEINLSLQVATALGF